MIRVEATGVITLHSVARFDTEISNQATFLVTKNYTLLLKSDVPMYTVAEVFLMDRVQKFIPANEGLILLFFNHYL